MKLSRRLGLAVSLAVVLCLASTGMAVGKQGSDTTAVGGAYQYPVKPGTAAWNRLKDSKEREAACQIPADALGRMTTDELIESVVDYPFLMQIYAFDTYEQGFAKLKASFNGYRALLERDDGPVKLLARYKATEVPVGGTAIDQSEVFGLSNLEAILCQSEVRARLSEAEVTELEEQMETKHLRKRTSPDVYGMTVATGYEVIAEQTQPDGVVSASATYYVYTPKGTAVPVFKRGEELSAAQKAAMDAWVTKTYPGTTVLRTATTNYNCHSYAWYSTSTANQYWMNDPTAYRTDGSYKFTSTWAVGRKMYYDYPGYHHSGNISAIYGSGGVSGTELYSKWGSYGLVKHRSNNCPYYYGALYMLCYVRN